MVLGFEVRGVKVRGGYFDFEPTIISIWSLRASTHGFASLACSHSLEVLDAFLKTSWVISASGAVVIFLNWYVGRYVGIVSK